MYRFECKSKGLYVLLEKLVHKTNILKQGERWKLDTKGVVYFVIQKIMKHLGGHIFINRRLA